MRRSLSLLPLLLLALPGSAFPLTVTINGQLISDNGISDNVNFDQNPALGVIELSEFIPNGLPDVRVTLNVIVEGNPLGGAKVTVTDGGIANFGGSPVPISLDFSLQILPLVGTSEEPLQVMHHVVLGDVPADFDYAVARAEPSDGDTTGVGFFSTVIAVESLLNNMPFVTQVFDNGFAIAEFPDSVFVAPPDVVEVDDTLSVTSLGGELDMTLQASRGVFLPASFSISVTRTSPVTEMEIDIKPGSDPNSINIKSKGKIPVAILTTNIGDGDSLDSDATQVDPLSVEFGPNGATETHGGAHIEDVDGDGDMDVVLHFKSRETGISCGDTEASLTGETFSGDAIEGTDSINSVGCK